MKNTIRLVGLSLFCSTMYGQQPPPNILFCIADDVSYPHMRAYGTTWLNTPGFDRVSQEGLLFHRMYACNAKSAPSRACIITGRNSWQLEEACNHWSDFPAKFKSYPEVLAENGYKAGATGKGWGPGFANDSLGNPRNMVGKMWNQIKLTPPTKGISNIDYAANFKEFLKNKPKGQPFCFWYGALEPHRGYDFGYSLKAGKNINQIDSVPSFWPDNEVVRTDMLDYALEIEHFDKHLVAILQALEETGELENTIVIVTADHGMPFPRAKGQEYEYSNHVPFAMMWKKGITKAGREIKDLLSFIDLTPTFLAVAGIPEEKSGMQPIEGKSFLDLLTKENSRPQRDYVLIGKERHDVGRPDDQGYPIRGIIKNDFLYLVNFETSRWPAGNPETGYMNVDGSPTKTEVLKARRNPETEIYWQLSFDKRQEEELYNISEDRECMANLAEDASYDTLKKQLRSELLQKLTEQQDPRMFGRGSIFDTYPYMGPSRDAWNRMKKGEDDPTKSINKSDFEPGASGLKVME
ncbi:MAG: sulfatase [Tannerellaceae bacterium]|jgi:arylsulfatase A-like enzyme|nr:sulfatase [Tannerellaceae bacterium]